MQSKQIKVTIDPIGNPVIEAIGFAGEGCAEATAPLEEMLSGGGENTRELKPEWQRSESSQQQHEHQTW